jgi:hypothetical protein
VRSATAGVQVRAARVRRCVCMCGGVCECLSAKCLNCPSRGGRSPAPPPGERRTPSEWEAGRATVSDSSSLSVITQALRRGVSVSVPAKRVCLSACVPRPPFPQDTSQVAVVCVSGRARTSVCRAHRGARCVQGGHRGPVACAQRAAGGARRVPGGRARRRIGRGPSR